MSRPTGFAGLVRSYVSQLKSKSKSKKDVSPADSWDPWKQPQSGDPALAVKPNHSLLSGSNFPKKEPTPRHQNETNKTAGYRQDRSRIGLPDIETEVIEIEKDGKSLPAILLNQSMAKDWNIVLKYKTKIERYTEELHSTDVQISRLEESEEEAIKEGDAYVETQDGMELEDIIKSKTIQRVRAQVADLRSKLKELSERRRTVLDKLNQAQGLSDVAQSNLETTIQRLFEENGLLNGADTPAGSSAISPTQSSLPVSPDLRTLNASSPKRLSLSASEVERRKTQQKIWDLSEELQTLDDKISNWPMYRTKRLQGYLQALQAGETSDTQTVFDLKLLKECQTTTRALIDAEEEYSKTETHARDIGVFVDDGEKEEGFGDYDDDGYTISQEQEMKGAGYLDWIYGWMEETPEKDAEPDIAGWPETGLDEWDARVVEMDDSVSVRDIVVSVGRRRERIDEYRKFCNSLKNAKT